MSLKSGGGLSKTVGSVTLTEDGDNLNVDVHPDPPYVAHSIRVGLPDWAYWYPIGNFPEELSAVPAEDPDQHRIEVRAEIVRPLDNGEFEIVGNVEVTFGQDSFTADAIGTGGGGGGGPDNCPRQ